MTPRWPAAIAVTLFLLLINGSALAHKPSDSYLRLEVDGRSITGQWDIALRDLHFALGLDSDQNNAITWAEVKAKHTEIAAYALSRLSLGPAEARCVPVMGEHLIDNHSDGAYAVLRFTADCPAAPMELEVGYRLFFDIDPQHRGLLNLTSQGVTQTGIFSEDAPERRFPLSGIPLSAQFADYFKDGVWHIWSGFDHSLFLLALLLPAVLVGGTKPGEAWIASPQLRGALKTVIKAVTAFTVAHAITLSLASLGVIGLSTRVTESAIAATVLLAALNNIRPVVNAGNWIIAFCFGLIHGFGFASALMGLGLPKASLSIALVAFNLGVEAGQLAIVALFLPIANALCYTPALRRIFTLAGSAAVAGVATLWLIERAFGVMLLPVLG